MKPSPKLLTPNDHALVLINYEGQMVFATKSISISELRTNVSIIAGASQIFKIPTIVTTEAEKTFAGPVFPEIEEIYPKATSGYIDRTSMNTWEDETAYNAIKALSKPKLVFAGLWTSVCIVGPVLSAIAEGGYEIYVVTDACGDVSTEAHERAVLRIANAGATPLTSIQYLLELQRDWARESTYASVMNLIKKYGGSYGIGIDYAKNMLKH
jgi:nicotinamidase-related amidase